MPTAVPLTPEQPSALISEHDYKEEKCQKVHSYDCRRCALSVRLNAFKAQILKVLRDINFVLGDPDQKNRRP
jgi:hypothetical protein